MVGKSSRFPGVYTNYPDPAAIVRMHSEATDGGTFSFPPREMPTHATRRSIIAALQIVKERNANVSDSNERDWVSIITFDKVASVNTLASARITITIKPCRIARLCKPSAMTPVPRPPKPD